MKRIRLLGLIAALWLALPASAPAAVTDFPAGYRAHHTFRELRTELEALASLHPTLVKLRSIGRSYEGRKLFVVKISDNVVADEAEPEIYIDGGTHGHEHLSTEQALALIHWLVDGYGTEPRATAIVDSTEVWVAPMINPDGATYDVASGVFKQWRKNRKPYGGAIGADINRTFGYRWGGAGSSGDPANAFYRGPRPWTAPEARRVRDFVLSRVIGGAQQIQSALTIHSHGEFVMFPFGWTKESEPVDMRPGDPACLSALANGVAARNGYRATQAGKLYRSSGTFMDWAYARQRIYALTLEMSPVASVAGGWYVRDEDMPAILEDNRAALLWFLEQTPPCD